MKNTDMNALDGLGLSQKQLAFAEKLSAVAPDGSGFKVGDKVRWTNDYGVEWESIIIGFDYDSQYNAEYECFVHFGSDCYWMPHDHKTLTLIGKEAKLIEANTTLTARSTCDHTCVFSLEVISRTAKTATVKDGENTKRTKIHTDSNGDEYLRPESYSMAPIYRAKSATLNA